MNRLLLVVLLGSSLFGQRTDTIYQDLGTVVTDNTNSANVQNIGQAYHQVSLRAVSKTGQTCDLASNFVYGTLQYSYNNSIFVNFGITQNTGMAMGNGAVTTFYGVGAYPYVRFSVGTFDSTKCNLVLSYSGSLSTGLVGATGLVPPTERLNGSAPLLIGGVSGPGTSLLTSNLATLMPVCTDTKIVVVPTGTTVLAFTASPLAVASGVGYIHICHIAITADAAATAKLIKANAANCTTGAADISPAFTLATGVPLTIGSNIGNAIRVTFTNTASNSICVTSTGGNVQALISYAVSQ